MVAEHNFFLLSIRKRHKYFRPSRGLFNLNLNLFRRNFHGSSFPSPLGVFLIWILWITKRTHYQKISVPSRGLFNLNCYSVSQTNIIEGFPSPLGVFLIWIMAGYNGYSMSNKCPSPLGVFLIWMVFLCILMCRLKGVRPLSGSF